MEKNRNASDDLKKSCEVDLLTPQKTDTRRPTSKSQHLPEKYKIVVDLFDRMICSLRLLALRNKPSSFLNVSTLVQVLSNRKLTYNQLAQIKYILPEGVQIDKTLVQDDKSLCMKPDIKITLLYAVIQGHQQKSQFIALRQLFTSKIIDFIDTHPEDCDIPEARLPVPFKFFIPEPSATKSSSLQNSDNMNVLPVEETQLTKLSVLSTDIQLKITDTLLTDQTVKIDQHKEKPTSIETHHIQPQYSTCETTEIPPVELNAVADNFMSQTPAQSTPKRSFIKTENNLKTNPNEKGASHQKSTKRNLIFQPEGDESGSFSTMDGEEPLNVGNSSNSKADETDQCSVDEIVAGNITQFDKVNESYTCTATESKRNQTDILKTDLVTLIHNIFGSTGRSSMTKEELLHKIIMSDCDIMERREVEEQIEHLEKKVPDWLCRRVTHGGDVLYKMKKVFDLDQVRAKLNSK